jgi:hypothetical protein
MVFRLRRIDITLINNLAESCPYYIEQQHKMTEAVPLPQQPLLFAVK